MEAYIAVGGTIFLSTPSARRATINGFQMAQVQLFLSTPSARRATICCEQTSAACLISIHALREEGDQMLLHLDLLFAEFLSTPSARRATGHGPRHH